ncbi:urea ABC transporter substrate-binding protein [Candidatus Manganitrophus noduliformans]|uniref:Urea ABC transporter substrate-binding protein n=1 Tax=Candidatus Manganitrophus noduliformans TaxID=2606439 RepID=A0A7X6I9N2_9BACT|nr:urea ABC transporter substrate-binding protein [Candidatus Manganitrophus noduliformans]NKE69653.1 urea ABC transporter substrate-binding protein [Candidatus Manganitrophus noduliformans]
MVGEKKSTEGVKTKRRYLKPTLFGLLVLLAVGVVGTFAAREVANAAGEEKPPIKIGILHSLSGTMAISEQSIKDIMMMGIEEINAKGGVLGRKIEPIVEDPASNWDLFAEKAKKLLVQDKVPVIFGCWTSVSRKSVLPVVEKNNGLLFYPVQYEGEECSRNIIYTGASVNQQAVPAVEYFLSKEGGEKKKFYLLGTDYVYPRTTNKILRAMLLKKGIAEKDIMEEYTPFHHQDYQTIVAKIKRFCAGGKAAVINTVNGDSNVPLFKELANTGVKADECPVMSFSVAEDELRGLDTKPLVGHLAAWNYFQSVSTPENKELVKKFKAFAKKNNLPGGASRVVDDPMFWGYNGLYLWKAAVEKAGSTDVDAVLKAYPGLEVQTAAGKIVADTRNHHTAKPVYIGRILANGQFEIIWQSKGLVTPEPWSEYTYPDRQCDWSKGGKGSFDMKGGQKVFLDPSAMPIEPM